MMKSKYMKKNALRTACLIAVAVCTIFSSKVQGAEENGMPQPSSAKIYSSMSEGSDIIANLIVGNVFEVLSAENDPAGSTWYRVRTDFGAEGYVRAAEMDKLIMDAQTMLSQAALDAADEEPAQENAGESAAVGEDSGAEEPVQENVGEGAAAGENAGAEEPQQGAGAGGQEPEPAENAGGTAPIEDNAGAERAGEDTAAPENGAESSSESVEGAGFGKDADSQDADNATIGSENFTVIERTDNSKVRGQGRIDAMLMMIMAGGIVCIIAIAVLLKRIMKCIGTRV